eukprot:g7235.t1
MATPTNQFWDFRQAVAELSTGIVMGVAGFLAVVMKPFDNCGLGHNSQGGDDESTEGGSAALPANDRLVVHGGGLSKGMDERRRLTRDTLGTLSLVSSLACRESTSSTISSSSSSNVTLDVSSTDSSLRGSLGGEDGVGSDDGANPSGAKPRVTFDHGVDVRIAWHAHLASLGQEADTGRGRASTMVDDDEFSSLVEAASAARTAFVQPPRVPSRAARFAMIEDDGDHDEDQGGRKPIAYGRMKDIVSSSRRGGINGNRGEDGDEGEDGYYDGDEEDEEEDGLSGLFGSYDGSLASMKRLVFPPTFSSSRYINGRPLKKLFDSSALASRSRAKWMTRTELDGILSRTKGWKDGTVGGSNGRRSGGRRAGRKQPSSYGFAGKQEDSAASTRKEMARVSVDNTVLKDQLFGLAMEEHRAALLFKRAFLNWEESSSNW